MIPSCQDFEIQGAAGSMNAFLGSYPPPHLQPGLVCPPHSNVRMLRNPSDAHVNTRRGQQKTKPYLRSDETSRERCSSLQLITARCHAMTCTCERLALNWPRQYLSECFCSTICCDVHSRTQRRSRRTEALSLFRDYLSAEWYSSLPRASRRTEYSPRDLR